MLCISNAHISVLFQNGYLLDYTANIVVDYWHFYQFSILFIECTSKCLLVIGGAYNERINRYLLGEKRSGG